MRGTTGLLMAAALVACSQNGGGNGASGAGPAAGGGSGTGTAAGGVALQPGQWETTVQIEAANIPNMPPGMAPPAMQPITARVCITREMAANPSPDAIGGAQQRQQQGACRTENYSFANGRIDGTMICNTGGVSSRTTISGQFTPTSYEQTLQTETQAGGTTQNSTMRISGRRIGDCPAR